MRRSVAEDDSEINWVDNENVGDEEQEQQEQDYDYDGSATAEEEEQQQQLVDNEDDNECGFDLRSTGSTPLLGRSWQRRTGTGNQKGIKLNSNYHEDAEIDALNRRRAVSSGKNKGVRDWAKVRNDNCKGGSSFREGPAKERIEAGAMSSLGRESNNYDATESRYSGSNCRGGGDSEKNNNSHSNDEANDRGLAAPAAASTVIVPEDELETVILRLNSTSAAEEELGGEGGGRVTTACVT